MAPRVNSFHVWCSSWSTWILSAFLPSQQVIYTNSTALLCTRVQYMCNWENRVFYMAMSSLTALRFPPCRYMLMPLMQTAQTGWNTTKFCMFCNSAETTTASFPCIKPTHARLQRMQLYFGDFVHLLLALTTALSASRKMVTIEPRERLNSPILSEITWG